jgi:23S rRNA pseudouridine2604 synthase
MGELDMFSRREADRLILNGRVLVYGNFVEVGHKVPSDLQADQIEIIDESSSTSTSIQLASSSKQNHKHRNNSNITHTVVLNKPMGYVSGQAEHGHPPAIRLLTSRNRIRGTEDPEHTSSSGNDNYDGLSGEARRRRHYYDWKGFAPAGRLDLDSTGLLVFTKNGVLAKKLIGATSSIEKEYIVDVAPAARATKRELSMDPNFVLPVSSSEQQRYDLAPILKGGGFLLGDDRPLKACPMARWIVKGEKLQIVLTEGRKHQIRRMCRELLGFHVVGLHRVRIGPIVLPSTDIEDDGFENDEDNNFTLPEGCWRPLRQKEMEFLLPNVRQ